jgi:hypothetical protein
LRRAARRRPVTAAATLLIVACLFPGVGTPRSVLAAESSSARTRNTAADVMPVIATATPKPFVLSVRVVGNHFVDGQGRVVRLLGVSLPGMDVLPRSGKCWTIPTDPQLVNAMAAWHINTVRIPLNEDCWLGINGANPTTTYYRDGLHRFVSLLHKRRLYAILDLHQSAPGAMPTSNQTMPDADHSPAFWTSVASSFVHDRAVVFDIFNEPNLVNVKLPKGVTNWACWLSGCRIDILRSNGLDLPVSWQAVGMQQLVNAVRKAGARQPIMVEGVLYGNDLSGWFTHTPADPAHQLAASIHVYNEAIGCVQLECWNRVLVPVARKFPVVTGEFGEDDCSHAFMDKYMKFADAHGVSYLGWSWSLETDCRSQSHMGLITDWNGTPSSSGIGLRNHLDALIR